MLAGKSGGAANLHAPAALDTRERVLLGEHVQVPECQTGSHLGNHLTGLLIDAKAVSRDADGSAELEVAEERHTRAGVGADGGSVHGLARGGGVTTAADANHLDLGHDEAVAAAVLAHDAVQVRKAGEVVDLLVGCLGAHASVPLVIRLDNADDTTTLVTVDGLLVVGGVVGHEVDRSLVGGEALAGAERHVGVALGNAESGADLGAIVVTDDVVKGRLAFRHHVALGRGGQGHGIDRDLEERHQTRDGADGLHVEVIPAAEVTDVPPVVGAGQAATTSGYALDEGRGGVGAGQVIQEGGSGGWLAAEGIVLKLRSQGVLDSRGDSRDLLLKALSGLNREVVHGHGRGQVVRSGLSSRGLGDVARKVTVGRVAETVDDGLIDASSRARTRVGPHAGGRVGPRVSGHGGTAREVDRGVQARAETSVVRRQHRNGAGRANRGVAERASRATTHGGRAGVRCVVRNAAGSRRRPAVSDGAIGRGLGGLIL